MTVDSDGGCERRVEIVTQVIDMLETDRQSQQVRCDARRAALDISPGLRTASESLQRLGAAQ